MNGVWEAKKMNHSCTHHHHHSRTQQHQHQHHHQQQQPSPIVVDGDAGTARGEATPLLLLREKSSASSTSGGLFVEPGEEDPLTAQALHQVAHDIHEFGIVKERLNWFLIYIVAILLYLGLNATLLVANSFDQDFIEDHYELPMHYLSFWGVFGFTVVEAVLLLSTGVVGWERKVASSVILFDVCLAFFSACLYSLDPEVFEVPSHYAEYVVQIAITCVNLIFVNDRTTTTAATTTATTGKKKKFPDKDGMSVYQWIQTASSYATLLLSFLQLILYSGMLPVPMGGERSAHFCEFTNEIINGLFALEYAIRCCEEWKESLDQHKV